MADQDSSQAPGASPWSFDPTGGAAAAPSVELPPELRLPPSYFFPGGDGTQPAAASPFSGMFDGPSGGGSGGNPLDAVAGNLDKSLQHPGGSPAGVNLGDRSFQVEGDILPGLIDRFQVRPYVEGVPFMGPPGMPAPWDTGH